MNTKQGPWHHEQDSRDPLRTWCGGQSRGDTWGGSAEVTCPNCKIKPIAKQFHPVVERYGW